MQKYDIDLDRRDIQQLSQLNEITAFFARLGYSTDVKTEQTAKNLGITAEGAKRPIKHIWLIADEDTFLQIYLFKLKSVTMTNIRELTRVFRNKAGNYLLVLTSDYNRIDFVLIERLAPTTVSDGIKIKQANVRPRVLTVDRKTPDPVSIRVLRRFTYTESDPFYQYEKLLFAYSIADWSEEYFNNRALFSDYFLLNRLQASSEWLEDPKPAYNRLKEIYKDGLSKYLSEREADIRSKLYEPTFIALGFQFKVGKGSTDPAHEQPDYYLFSPKQDSKKDRPIAVALVYPWGRSLDGKDDTRDKDTPDENPGAAVVSLLEDDQAPWAIVTNGQTWRLYSQKTHSRATNYYEIDLIEALSLGNPAHIDPAQAFRFYWLFFRYDAFEKKKIAHEGKEITQSFLDQILTGSEDYAKELGERLKERIFERIFPHLAEGIIADIRKKEGKDASLSQERLDQIFHGTLALLYRLLFLLYAESRDLLPAKEVRGYYEASIKKLKTEVAEAAGTIEEDSFSKISKRYKTDEFDINNRLTKLFKVIDKGDEKLNVPVYNGGLFITEPDAEDDSVEAANARFLSKHSVPDRYMAQAIDLMARDLDDKRQDLVFIDYKSLGVRHLGSMYEGLLEFRLRIAPEKMAIVKGKKTEEIITYKEAKSKKRKILTNGRGKNAVERVLSKGSVYLENDKRERKATGSYYTPEHIVNYIVEHAVGPVLKEKLEGLRPKLRDVEQRQKAFDDRQKALKHSGINPEPEEKKKLIGQELVDEVFNIRVLDPAMGSGHFLVQAVDFITDKMLDFLNSFPVNPVHNFLEKTRETILKELDSQGITIDAGRLTDINLLKRHILKRCIYGVDLNPMAVELAKVSLWLDCFTLGAPLSFLDHHLRCGNSLIGVTVKEAKDFFEKGQLSLFGTPFEGVKMAADLMRQVGFTPDVTSKCVAESRKKYKRATDALAPFKRILDVYTSRWFGNEPSKSGRGQKKVEYHPTKEFLQSQEANAWLKEPKKTKLSNDNQKVTEVAMRTSREKRFFHWELEFPEVFYGPRPGTEMVIERLEGAGFDAVVGNPPYVRQEGIGDWKPAFKTLYSHIYSGVVDIYAFFIFRGFSLLSQNGNFSYIVANKWILANYGKALRNWLKSQHIEEIIDFGDLPIFDEATTYTCILRISKKERSKSFRNTLVKTINYENLNEYVSSNKFDINQENLNDEGWVLSNHGDEAILNKIKSKGIPLGDYIGEKIYRGVLTGLNDAFVINEKTREDLIKEDSKCSDIIMPFLIGKDIKRYIKPKTKRYLIFSRHGINIDNYPAIKKHLSKFKKRLVPKPSNWKGDKWEGRKPGRYKWYEIQDTIAYYEEFEKPKIIYPNICKQPEFTFDPNGNYTNQKCFIIASDDKYLLGILNSKLNKYLFYKYLPKLRGGFFEPSYVIFKNFPIKKLDMNVISEKEFHFNFTALIDKMINLSNSVSLNDKKVNEIHKIDEAINDLVYKLYDLSPEEINLIEKIIE
ncbi:MAG: Eco57I restriction-modification methylase domain-containing protein [Candidatus Hodarchaeota archaeon]